MEADDRALALVGRWEHLRRQGQTVTPHDLCPDDPALRAQIAQAIEQLQGTGSVFDLPEAITPPTLPPSPPTGDFQPPALGESGPDPANAHPAWIGKYRVIEHLGGGGQAEVYHAVHPHLPGREVVLKWAKQRLPEHLRHQLLQEARVLAELEETGVARVYDVDVCDGRPFVVLEYLRGRSLQQVLAQRRPSPREAAAWVAALAASLDRVHQRGVCHCDLKPSNVLIDAAGRPRLVDFGLAVVDRPWDGAGRPVEGIAGTFQYMAPEQANGQTERIGLRSDIFGLGAILYALLTGRPPHQDRDILGVWEKARQGIVTPPRQFNPRIPRALECICLKALALDPDQRYASAGELAAALRRFGRRCWSLLAVAAGAAALIALVAVLYQMVRWPASTAGTGGGLSVAGFLRWGNEVLQKNVSERTAWAACLDGRRVRGGHRDY